MVTLRCTQKLLRRLHTPASVDHVAPTTALGDWYANLYFTRPEQIVLCMNERSLLAVIVPFREARTLGVRFCDAATGLLARIGVPPQAVAAESAAMGEVAFGATANRKVLGCLNEAAFELGAESSLGRRLFGSLAEMEDHLSENIYSTTGYRRPRDLATELLAAASVSFGTH